MGTLANNEDPDEMPLKAAFHQALYCLLGLNPCFMKEIQYVLEITTQDPSVYSMGHPDFIICSLMENSIDLKRVNVLIRLNMVCSLCGNYNLRSFNRYNRPS